MTVPGKHVVEELATTHAEELFELATKGKLPESARHTCVMAANEIVMLRKLLDTSRKMYSDAVMFIEDLESRHRGRGRYPAPWGKDDTL